MVENVEERQWTFVSSAHRTNAKDQTDDHNCAIHVGVHFLGKFFGVKQALELHPQVNLVRQLLGKIVSQGYDEAEKLEGMQPTLT